MLGDDQIDRCWSLALSVADSSDKPAAASPSVTGPGMARQAAATSESVAWISRRSPDMPSTA